MVLCWGASKGKNMTKANILFLCANVFLFGLAGYFVATRGISPPPIGWEYKDLLTIILTALAALLAAIAIFIGILAIWGYASIRDAAMRAAESKAEEIAIRVSEPVATRVAEAAVRATAGDDRTDELTEALSRKDGES